ncbi:MAG: hypothetical protein WBE86_11300 [Candidatus Acidiferrales bacterium]
MKSLALFGAVCLVALAASANPRTFRGQIMDSECATNAHSATRSHREMAGIKGNITNRQCTILCVEQGDSVYMFLDQNGKNAYKLSTPQKDLKQYAGDKVEIVGSLDAQGKVISVSKIKLLSDTGN